MARVFSGIQPSGELHIGNYLGAVQSWVKLQHQHDCLFCVVDLHAITQPYDAATLAQRTIDMAIGLFAAGIDPARAIVFVQSHVPEHTELYWVLNTVTPLGELERQTAFKDKAQRQESVPAGLLNYPVLQAADVLLYEATPGSRTGSRSPSHRRCSRPRNASSGSTARPRCPRASATRSPSSIRPIPSGKSSSPRPPTRRASPGRTRVTPTSATSSPFTRVSRHRTRSSWWRTTAAPQDGVASTASGCSRTI